MTCELNNDNYMPLIGDIAPSFNASTTNGPIKFPEDLAGKWVILFSHPGDFTPVCTTEFIALQQEYAELKKLNTELLGLSVGSLASHLGWIDAIEKMPDGIKITFPLIDDMNMSIAKKYGMIHHNASDTHTVRAVFIIDPHHIIRAIMYYPATLGRNTDEIKRALIGLQVADMFRVAVGANWMPGAPALTPSPATAKQMRQSTQNNPWFIKYTKVNTNDIYRKKTTKQKNNIKSRAK